MWKDQDAFKVHNQNICSLGTRSFLEKMKDPEFKRQFGLKCGGMKWKDKGALKEHCKKISKLGTAKIKELWHNENFRKNIAEKNRVHALNQWQFMREKMVQSMKGIKHPNSRSLSEQEKLNLSERRKAQWKTLEYRKKMFKCFHPSPETIEKRLKGLFKRPTSLEIQFQAFINRYGLPYRYTGNGGFLVGFKNPDFVNINGDKICIEVANRYHHQGDWAERRIEHFAKWGWKCFVIWEDELSNNSGILEKIVGVQDAVRD